MRTGVLRAGVLTEFSFVFLAFTITIMSAADMVVEALQITETELMARRVAYIYADTGDLSLALNTGGVSAITSLCLQAPSIRVFPTTTTQALSAADLGVPASPAPPTAGDLIRVEVVCQRRRMPPSAVYLGAEMDRRAHFFARVR